MGVRQQRAEQHHSPRHCRVIGCPVSPATRRAMAPGVSCAMLVLQGDGCALCMSAGGRRRGCVRRVAAAGRGGGARASSGVAGSADEAAGPARAQGARPPHRPGQRRSSGGGGWPERKRIHCAGDPAAAARRRASGTFEARFRWSWLPARLHRVLQTPEVPRRRPARSDQRLPHMRRCRRTAFRGEPITARLRVSSPRHPVDQIALHESKCMK